MLFPTTVVKKMLHINGDSFGPALNFYILNTYMGYNISWNFKFLLISIFFRKYRHSNWETVPPPLLIHFWILLVIEYVLLHFIMIHQYSQDLFFNSLVFNRIMLKIKHELSSKCACHLTLVHVISKPLSSPSARQPITQYPYFSTEWWEITCFQNESRYILMCTE